MSPLKQVGHTTSHFIQTTHHDYIQSHSFYLLPQSLSTNLLILLRTVQTIFSDAAQHTKTFAKSLLVWATARTQLTIPRIVAKQLSSDPPKWSLESLSRMPLIGVMAILLGILTVVYRIVGLINSSQSIYARRTKNNLPVTEPSHSEQETAPEYEEKDASDSSDNSSCITEKMSYPDLQFKTPPVSTPVSSPQKKGRTPLARFWGKPVTARNTDL